MGKSSALDCSRAFIFNIDKKVKLKYSYLSFSLKSKIRVTIINTINKIFC